MKHKMSKEALADFKEVVQHLKDNDRFYSGGDPNISAPQERWISSNAGPVIKGNMQSLPSSTQLNASSSNPSSAKSQAATTCKKSSINFRPRPKWKTPHKT